MALSDLIKPERALDTDGGIDVYEIETGILVAHYQGLEVHKKLLQAEMWKKERQALLEMTGLLEEHPEGYEGPCLCKLCSYEADHAED